MEGNIQKAPKLYGKDQDVEVTIINMPYLVASDNSKSYIDDEFGMWLIEELDKFDMFAKKKGFLKKTFLCSKCGSQLSKEGLVSHTFDFTLMYKENEFAIKIKLASVKNCQACSHPNCMNERLSSNIRDALINAFETFGINP